MKLLIARHGEAHNVGENGITRDVDRSLSGVGQKQIRNVASCLMHHNIKVDLLISSPYLRTLQTRDIFAKELNIQNIAQSDFLQSGAKLEDLESLFKEYQIWENYTNKTVMLIGHAPDVGRFCDFYLATKGLFLNPANITMINFPVPESLGQLSAFWTPDLFSNK